MSTYKRLGKYWINLRYNGVRYRKASPDNSNAGAKTYEALIRQKLAHGENIFTDIKKKEETMPTFEEFSKKWFDVYVKTNNKYSETLNKTSVLRAHLVPFFGSKKLDKISNLDVETYKAKKLQEGQSCKSVNNHLIVLNKCFKTAEDWEVLKTTPKVKLLKVAPQKFDFLSIDECQTLLDHCDGILKEMVLLGLKTGLRFGELIALEWTDINFKSGLMTVQKSISRGLMGSTKSNKIRYVPLLEDVSQMLSIRAQKKGFVFNKLDNEPLGSMLCLRHLHDACEKAEMRKIGWHTLRHTFASHLAQNNVSIMVIKELLGHADIKTTMRYSHLTPSKVKDAIETLNKDNGHNMVTIQNIEEPKSIALIPNKFKLLQKT